MFDESRTNTVLFSRGLRRFYSLYGQLLYRLQVSGVKLLGCDFKNIWVRDHAPIQVNDHFVKFRLHKTPKSAGDVSKDEYDFLWNVKGSSIVLDGGNCQRGGEYAVITDIIFRDNPKVEKKKLIARLERLLESRVVIIPREPGDPLGHSDGIVKFLPRSQTVLVNDYVRGTEAQKRHQERYSKILHKSGLSIHLFPNGYHRRPQLTAKEFWRKYPGADAYNTAFGYYVNFLVVGHSVLLPTFGIEEDESARKCVQEHFKTYSINTLDCTDLSFEGGCVACVTAQYEM
jgi:agmatine deiminase